MVSEKAPGGTRTPVECLDLHLALVDRGAIETNYQRVKEGLDTTGWVKRRQPWRTEEFTKRPRARATWATDP